MPMIVRRIPLLAAALLPLAACALEPGDVTGDDQALVGDPAAFDAVPPVTWKTDTAVVQGTGCNGLSTGSVTSPQDAWVIANGADVSIVFTKMTIDLPGAGADTSLALRKNCAVRIPVSVVRGFYIGELEQTLGAGVS